MKYTLYICNDFKFENKTLTITDVLGILKSNDKNVMNNFIDKSNYNAVVCPELFMDENKDKPNKIIIESKLN